VSTKATFQLWLIVEKSSAGERLGTGEGMVVAIAVGVDMVVAIAVGVDMVVAIDVGMGMVVVIVSGGVPQEGINNPIQISSKEFSSTFFI
jgi:hypothetical protein